jgi:4-amino-4-deoxy-L-arabinose transferase-like glycosyltransferase
MSATTFSEARDRGRYPERLSERWAVRTWALPAILVLAGLNFFWQLGSSSYFIDEAFSVIHSLPGFHTMLHAIGHTETTPYTYFLFLHEWMALTGSQAEWVTRLPSAVAGVGLVWATYWMAGAFVERRAALCAAALCAFSPLVLSYAQETRVYVFLMAACVVSVAATVRASQRTDGRIRLLALGAASAFVALWLHYTAISVVLPLIVWVGTRSTFSVRQRAAFIAPCLIAAGTLLPLLLEQYHYNPNGGAILGAVNFRNVASVVGTPFASRVGTPVNVRTVVGALVVLAAVPAVLLSPRRRVAQRGLLVAVAIFGVLALIAVDLTGKHILITRYTTITAPFLATLIVAACVQLPRVAAAVLAIAAAVVALAGVIDNHSPRQFYAPVREVVEYIAPHQRPGDFMLSPGYPLTDTALFYYVTRRTHPKLHFFGLHDPGIAHAFRTYKRIWIVDNPPKATDASAVASVRRLLRRYRWHEVETRVYSTSLNLGLLLTLPDGHRRLAGGRY